VEFHCLLDKIKEKIYGRRRPRPYSRPRLVDESLKSPLSKWNGGQQSTRLQQII
jgi:hypothetical protein